MKAKLAELAKAGRFAAVGVANTLVDFGVFTLLAQLLGVNVYAAQVIGYSAGVVNSYVLNRSWTFRSRERFFGPALVKFLLLSVCMLLLSTAILYLCYDVAGLPKLIAKAVATAVTMVVNFLVNRFWVFRAQ